MSSKVLVVDDQEFIREMLSECLEFGGYESCVASNGEEGLRELYEHRPDLVITDMRMPGMDGFEFSRLVRQACKTPIIMLTGVGQDDEFPHSINTVNAYMSKPVEMIELLDQVKTLLEQSHAVEAVSK